LTAIVTCAMIISVFFILAEFSTVFSGRIPEHAG
jgi:hypothetical protein